MNDKAKSLKPVEGDAKPQPKPQLQPAKRGDAVLRDLRNNVYMMVVERGVRPEELDGHQSYWNALEVNEGDTIKVIARDRAWYATFEVVSAMPGSVVARLAYWVKGAPIAPAGGPKPIPEGYRIARTEPGDPRGRGFVVIREKDGFVISDSGCAWGSYQEAYETFLQHAIFRGENTAQYFPR